MAERKHFPCVNLLFIKFLDQAFFVETKTIMRLLLYPIPFILGIILLRGLLYGITFLLKTAKNAPRFSL